MATYTVTGRPLNYTDLGPSWPAIKAILDLKGVGSTVTLTLAGPDDTTAKGHGILK